MQPQPAQRSRSLAQHGLVGNMETPVDVSYIAKTVMFLRCFENEGAIHRAVSSLKKRLGQHECSLGDLRFSSKGSQVVEALTRLHGVLTSVPEFVGQGPVMKEGSSSE